MEEDMILPDDFETQPQAEEVTEQTEVTEPQIDEPTEAPTDEVTEPVDTPQMVKLKYNHQEEEVTLDEAIQLAQMGKNYPKLQEKLQALESDPRLSLVEELAQSQGMSVDEYVEAVRQYQEEQQLNELLQQNIPEEYAKEMLANRQFRQQYEQERQVKVEEEQKNAEFADFFQYFRDKNGRDFVPDKDEIPQSVWEANAQGIPLKYAFADHLVNSLQQQLQTLKQNETNAKRAPIAGVTQHGSTEVASEDPFLQGFNSI